MSVEVHRHPKHLNTASATQMMASSQERDDEDIYRRSLWLLNSRYLPLSIAGAKDESKQNPTIADCCIAVERISLIRYCDKTDNWHRCLIRVDEISQVFHTYSTWVWLAEAHGKNVLRSGLFTLNDSLQDSAEQFSCVHIISSGASGIVGNESCLCAQHTRHSLLLVPAFTSISFLSLSCSCEFTTLHISWESYSDKEPVHHPHTLKPYK